MVYVALHKRIEQLFKIFFKPGMLKNEMTLKLSSYIFQSGSKFNKRLSGVYLIFFYTESVITILSRYFV